MSPKRNRGTRIPADTAGTENHKVVGIGTNNKTRSGIDNKTKSNISNKTNEKKGVEADRITNAEKARPFLRAIKTRTATQNPKMPSSGKQ